VPSPANVFTALEKTRKRKVRIRRGDKTYKQKINGEKEKELYITLVQRNGEGI
jgi:hypothetical protein